MDNLVNNASALSLATERLKVFTRYEAYRCKIPPTKIFSNNAFRKFPQMPSLISPCEHKFLLPEETLKSQDTSRYKISSQLLPGIIS